MIITGYTGTLLVDPRTGGRVRCNVRTEELPPSTGTCETDTSLEYGLVALGGNDYLLPAKTVQTFVGRDGSEDENRIAFASCREYRAASTLTFGEGPHSSLLKELDVDPHVRAEQMGHTIDVNENVYTITSLKRRKEAVNALEKAIGA